MIATDAVLANRYQIEELLSQKAGRRTFLAKDLQSQVSVIIKLLRFGDDFEWDDLKLFEREAVTLKNLDHSQIPKYLDYFHIDEANNSGFALVQSYIKAPSLETLASRGRKYSEAEIIELADRLLDLLAYLHQQCPPVIHRDIKPSNILLENRSGNSVGQAYLVDFGSVQTAAKKEEGTITIVGSYGYIPLEQFGGKTTTASDLYSLGMTLIYLLTGMHPAELPQVDGRVMFNAEISKRFERWLEKMTHPHLDKRFDSAKAAQLALKSEDGSYGDLDRLKPSYTQVRLYRDRNRLQITWPDSVDYTGLFQKMSNFVVFSLFASIFIAPRFSTSVAILLVWAHIFSLCLLSTWSILRPLFPDKISRIRRKCFHLIIDQNYIYKLKDRRYGLKPVKLSEHPKSTVEILVYSPGYKFDKYVDTGGRLIKGKAITIPPKLYLYCGRFEYSFSNKLSQAELWWLGQELSDFLNLELQVIYPTPKIPLPPSCGGGC